MGLLTAGGLTAEVIAANMSAAESTYLVFCCSVAIGFSA